MLIGLAGAIAGGLAAMPTEARACAACFGRSDSGLAKGMNMGILSLLLVVIFMWAGLAAFFIYLARKAAATNSEKGMEGVGPETTNSVR